KGRKRSRKRRQITRPPPAAPRKAHAAHACGDVAFSRKARGTYSGLKKTRRRARAKSGIMNSSHAHFIERGLQSGDGFMGSGSFHCPALFAMVLRRGEVWRRARLGPALLPGHHCSGSHIRHVSLRFAQGGLPPLAPKASPTLAGGTTLP